MTCPPRAYLKDEILLDMSRSRVKSVEKLDKVRGLPRPVEHEDGPDLVAATLRGLAVPTSNLPASRTVEPSPAERFRVDRAVGRAQVLCAGSRSTRRWSPAATRSASSTAR
jgi:ribonuclease D